MWLHQICGSSCYCYDDYYFTNGVVATEFSQLTASSSASCRIVSPLLSLVCSFHNVVHGLGLTTRAVWWLCQPPLVQRGFAGTLACAEVVKQGPWTSRKIKAWLSGNRIHHYGMAGYRSWLPVFFPLCVHVHMCQIGPDGMSWWKSWRWVIENISMNWPVLMAVYFGEHLVHGWLLTQVWWRNVSHWQPLGLCVMQTSWNKPHGTV